VIVVRMSKPDVLDRVSADLALGHTQPAIQRLSSLVATRPTDLDLRRRLARLHRMVGNRIEAGRWDYLTPGAGTAEVAAFERAFPSPSRRLAALRWPPRSAATHGPGQPARTPDPGITPTGYARARLDALARAATVELARIRTAAKHPPGRRWSPRVAGIAAGGVAAFFAVLGAVTVAQWLLR
jgi:hypothetical protein